VTPEQALAEAIEEVEHGEDPTLPPREQTPNFYGWLEYDLCKPADIAPLLILALARRGFGLCVADPTKEAT
jgi:hypothetical protein